MIKIVKKDAAILVTSDVQDDDFIGILMNKQKYIVISRFMVKNDRVFNIMNDGFHVGGNNYVYIKTMLESMNYTEAFKFATRKEMFDWFLKSE